MESIKLMPQLATFFIAILFACNLQDAPLKQERLLLNPVQFKEKVSKVESPQLIDVRTAGEFDGGTILNAENYDLLNGDFKAHLSKLDSTKTVYVFCAKGGRSGRAADLLESKGFHSIVDLKGGYTSWSAVKK